MKRVPADAERSRASSSAEAPPAHSASIEVELADDHHIGSIALDGGPPAHLEGFDELERILASIPSPQRPLVLVRAGDASADKNGLAQRSASR
jgi:hypothetical protein